MTSKVSDINSFGDKIKVGFTELSTTVQELSTTVKGDFDGLLHDINNRRATDEELEERGMKRSIPTEETVEELARNDFLKMPRMVYQSERPINSVSILDVLTLRDTYIVSATDDVVDIWSLRFGNLLLKLAGQHSAKISATASYVDPMTPPLVFTGSWDEKIVVHHLACTDEDIKVEKRTVLSKHTNRISELKTFQNSRSPEVGPILVSGGADALIAVWSLRTFTHLYTLSNFSLVSWVLCFSIYYSIELESAVVVSGSKDCVIRFWALKAPSDETEQSNPFRVITDCETRVIDLTTLVDADNEAYVTAICHNDLVIRMWKVSTGQIVRKFIGHHNTITSITNCYSNRLQCSVLVSVTADGNIRVWNSLTGEMLRTFRGHAGSIDTTCVFSPFSTPNDIIIISAGEDATVRAWLYQEEKSLAILRYNNSSASQRRRASTATKKESPASNERRVTITAIDSYSPVSPVSLVVTAADDGSVAAWNVSTRNFSTTKRWEVQVSPSQLRCLRIYTSSKEIRNIEQSNLHSESIDDLKTFSLDRNVVVCAGRDKIVYFIDLFSGVVVDRELRGHDGTVCCLDVTSDSVENPFLVTGTDERELKVWSLLSGRCLLELKGHKFDVNSVALYTPTNNVENSLIISGSLDSTIRLWGMGDGRHGNQVAQLEGVNAPVNAVVVNKCNVIAGSADASIKIWSLLHPYSLLFTLRRHLDEVTCLAVYPGTFGSYDTLVSGSLDKSVMIWNLLDNEYVSTVEGHFEEVSGVCLFSTDLTDPSIASASTNVRITFDFKNETVNKDYVNECFDFDVMQLNSKLHKAKQWPRMRRLVKKNQPALFLDHYCELFKKAVELSRPDFLMLFLPLSKPVVVKCILQYDLLKLAISMSDEMSVSIIITALIDYTHSGECEEISPTRLPLLLDDILLLGRQYPLEFERLFVNIQLIDLSADDSELLVDGKICLSSSGDDSYDMIKYQKSTELDSDNISTSNSNMTYSYLPLPSVADEKVLRVICDVCDELNSSSIFNSRNGILILRYSWTMFGQRGIVGSMLLYIVYLGIAVANIFAFEQMLAYSFSATRALLIIECCFELAFIYSEISSFRLDVWAYLRSLWNYLDAIVNVGGLIGSISRLYLMEETEGTRCTLSVTSIAMWFNLLYFLRAFESTGPLVKMIVKILYDTCPFLVVLLIVHIGFSQAFWLLAKVDTSISFSTWDGSLITSFSFMMGNFDPDAFDGLPKTVHDYGLILSCLYMFVCVILMLNLLIGLMGDSFSQVAENGLAEWRLEQAKLMLSNSKVGKKKISDDVIFYQHKKVSDTKDLLISEDEFSVEETLKSIMLQQSDMQRRVNAMSLKLDAK